MIDYLTNIGTAISQLGNTILGGHPDESISARSYRRQMYWHWNTVRFLANILFFWDRDHCLKAYLSDHVHAKQLVDKYPDEIVKLRKYDPHLASYFDADYNFSIKVNYVGKRKV